ncbi:MAG TPA: hypothetical protein VFB78_17590 [Acidimicrobiales bacterium]|nr:hypothetical protein [Acidimicrobiales bacterium]
MTLREFLDRYGPALAVVLGLALVIALLPNNNHRTALSAAAGNAASASGPATAAGEADATGPNVTVGPGGLTGNDNGQVATGGSASASGPAKVQVGQGKCRPDGRQYGISVYMPPCVAFSGGNGGATGQGVTADKVLVIRFISQVDPGTQAILEGANLADDPAIVKGAAAALMKYANQHYQTYGREVVLQDYNASGPDDDDDAMKTDARRIAKDIKAFAVLAGPLPVLGRELAQNGVVCICTVTNSSKFYTDNPPYIFGSLPTSTEYAQVIGEYIGKRMANRPAKWAGSLPAGMTSKIRKFGLIYIEGNKQTVDPDRTHGRDELIRELARNGVSLCDGCAYTYLYDPGRNQNDVSAIISGLRGHGVTTIMMFTDPLYPILITTEATRQTYFPEWFITGVGLSDTSAAGRLYDQNQWRHAFGISPLWVTWTNVTTSAGYREAHHGNPSMKAGDEGVLINVYRAPVQTLFEGIHLAGPKLTRDTFAQGEFNYPRTGGAPAAPLVFRTRAYPTEIKDFTEVFYDANARGKDERGQQGSGMVMKVNGGKRYMLGQWPRGDAQVFGDAVNPLAVSDNPPGGSTDGPHEQDGHTHKGACMSCPGGT